MMILGTLAIDCSSSTKSRSTTRRAQLRQAQLAGVVHGCAEYLYGEYRNNLTYDMIYLLIYLYNIELLLLYGAFNSGTHAADWTRNAIVTHDYIPLI